MREKANANLFGDEKTVGGPISPGNWLMPMVTRFGPLDSSDNLPGESVAERAERIHGEISHGKEYLNQVQAELKEQRRLLEGWAQYERTCSLQPLDHLVQTFLLKQSVEKFLVGWLKRRQKELDKLERKL